MPLPSRSPSLPSASSSASVKAPLRHRRRSRATPRSPPRRRARSRSCRPATAHQLAPRAERPALADRRARAAGVEQHQHPPVAGDARELCAAARSRTMPLALDPRGAARRRPRAAAGRTRPPSPSPSTTPWPENMKTARSRPPGASLHALRMLSSWSQDRQSLRLLVAQRHPIARAGTASRPGRPAPPQRRRHRRRPNSGWRLLAPPRRSRRRRPPARAAAPPARCRRSACGRPRPASASSAA